MEQIVLIEPLFIPFMCNNNTHTRRSPQLHLIQQHRGASQSKTTLSIQYFVVSGSLFHQVLPHTTVMRAMAGYKLLIVRIITVCRM